RIPPASHRATPIRTVPTSMARRTPRRSSATRAVQVGPGRRHCLRQCPRVGSAPLGDVVLASTTTAKTPGGSPYQGAGLDPCAPRGLVRRCHHHRTILDHSAENHHPRFGRAEPLPYVQGQAAQVVRAGCPVDHCTDEPGAAALLGGPRELSGAGEQLPVPERGQLLLRILQPGEQPADALGQLLTSDATSWDSWPTRACAFAWWS